MAEILPSDELLGEIMRDAVCGGVVNIWVNYNDLTATSLESLLNKGSHPLFWP